MFVYALHLGNKRSVGGAQRQLKVGESPHTDLPLLADQRPIAPSEPVIPLKIAEFDIDGLADVRQRVISTPCCPSRPAALMP